MRVVHVSFHVDAAQRRPEALFDAWPTFAATGPAIADENTAVTVVQAASQDVTIERDGVRFVFVRMRAPDRLRRRLGHWAAPAARRLDEAVAQCEPDVVHVHSLSYPLHVRRLRRRLPGVRMLVQDHADHPPPRWRRALHRSALTHVNGVAFTAAAQAEPFRRAGVLPDSVRVFEVPESSSTFTPGDVTAARTATGLSGNPCLLWLGHLDSNKDPLVALEAVARARADLPDAELWMCWLKAPLLDAVKQCVAADPWLSAHVHLLGARPHAEVEQMLSASDFLIQASHVEGSGYAVIEALACGATPIVTDIPSFRTLTGDGQFGALTPIGDAAAMARALCDWASRDRAALRTAARLHFEHALSFDAIGARWREIYHAVIDG